MNTAFNHSNFWNLLFSLPAGKKAAVEKNAKQKPVNLAAKAKERPLEILMGEDDADDQEIFSAALKEVLSKATLHFAGNGQKVLEFLHDREKLPDLVMLDLNMPKKNGIECLDAIRENKAFKKLPIVIYSTTANQEIVNATYDKGANLYCQKPTDFVSIKKLVQTILSLNFREYIPKSVRSKFLLNKNL